MRAKALVMVVSRTESLEAAVRQLSPEAIAVISSQDFHEVLAQKCLEFRGRVRFVYAIVDSPMEIRDSFDRFEHSLSELERLGYEPEEAILDATGGTTPMRLGAALAAMSRGMRMVHQRVPQTYVDGEWKRDESKEIEVVPMENPLESTGLLREGQGIELFDRRDYGAAALIFRDVASKVEGVERGQYYTGLALLAEGYAAWDVADYATALAKLPEARRQLSGGFSEPAFAKRAARLAGIVGTNLGFLGKVRGKLTVENVVDMLENARRRITDQGRHDDGVARLYRCVEMFHQWRLKEEHGVYTTDTDWDGLPEETRSEFLGRTSLEKLPRHLDLMLARTLDRVLSGQDEEDGNLFRDLLRQRNGSILAHGLNPIGEQSARRFLDYVDSLIDRPKVRAAAEHPRLEDV